MFFSIALSSFSNLLFFSFFRLTVSLNTNSADDVTLGENHDVENNEVVSDFDGSDSNSSSSDNESMHSHSDNEEQITDEEVEDSDGEIWSEEVNLTITIKRP